jgi:hypothetical protein
MRGTATDAITSGALTQRLDHRRMRGQAEIVITAEGEQLAAIDARARTLRTSKEAPLAVEAGLAQALKLETDLRHPTRPSLGPAWAEPAAAPPGSFRRQR